VRARPYPVRFTPEVNPATAQDLILLLVGNVTVPDTSYSNARLTRPTLVGALLTESGTSSVDPRWPAPTDEQRLSNSWASSPCLSAQEVCRAAGMTARIGVGRIAINSRPNRQNCSSRVDQEIGRPSGMAS